MPAFIEIEKFVSTTHFILRLFSISLTKSSEGTVMQIIAIASRNAISKHYTKYVVYIEEGAALYVAAFIRRQLLTFYSFQGAQNKSTEKDSGSACMPGAKVVVSIYFMLFRMFAK